MKICCIPASNTIKRGINFSNLRNLIKEKEMHIKSLLPFQINEITQTKAEIDNLIHKIEDLTRISVLQEVYFFDIDETGDILQQLKEKIPNFSETDV